MRETERGFYDQEDRDADDFEGDEEEEGLGLNERKADDMDRLIDETQAEYTENLEHINDKAQSTINDILMDVDEYFEMKPGRWAAVLTKLKGIIADYKGGFFDRADEDLEQLELKVRQIKNEIKS